MVGKSSALLDAKLLQQRGAAAKLQGDIMMLAVQALFFVNHIRRLLDESCSGVDYGAFSCRWLSSYPCQAAAGQRFQHVFARLPWAYQSSFQLPMGELWVPVVATAMLGQALALAAMPRVLYLTVGRRVCMVLVGLLPKACCLLSFVAFPNERPSSYATTYLPLEGAICHLPLLQRHQCNHNSLDHSATRLIGLRAAMAGRVQRKSVCTSLPPAAWLTSAAGSAVHASVARAVG
jgi:hypothetical protein